MLVAVGSLAAHYVAGQLWWHLFVSQVAQFTDWAVSS